jgi:hypothetical protein
MGLIEMLVTQNNDSQQKTCLYADCRSAYSTMEAVFFISKDHFYIFGGFRGGRGSFLLGGGLLAASTETIRLINQRGGVVYAVQLYTSKCSSF